MAEKQPPTWKDLEAKLEEIRAEWPALCTNPRLKFDAEREWVLQACNKTEKTPPIAIGNILAVQEALRNVAAVGVTLDPARKFAYILQRDGKMVYDLSYMGMLDLATASGAIQWAQARIVHTNDVFELAGYDAPPVHKFKPFAKPEERGDIIGAYVVVKTPGGDYLTATMHADEINAIRDRSPAFKNSQKGPWKTDWNEMAKKTVVKNAYKYWPRSEALDRAIHYLNTDGGQGIDLAGEDSGIKALLDGLLAEVAAAATGTAVATVWAKRGPLKEHPDAYGKLREAIAARNAVLGVVPPAKPSTGAASEPNPAPGAAPAATPAPTAKPGPKPGSYAHIVDLIKVAETDAALEATGPMIDALPADQQQALNDMYNERLAYLNRKFNRKAAA